MRNDPSMRALYIEWGQNIAQQRIAQGMNQDDLAEKLGVQQSTISRWESGTSAPSDYHKRELVRKLGVPARMLFPIPSEVA